MKKKTKAILISVPTILTIIGIILAAANVGISLWQERANITISFNDSSEYLSRNSILGYHSTIKVSNIGKDKSRFDLIVTRKNAQISFDRKNWDKIAKASILSEPSLYDIYVQPESNSETFTITLSSSKSPIDLQTIDYENVELTYKRTIEGNYVLMK